MSKKLFSLPKKGFTLIEILVVIAIMATLAAGVLYSTDNARDKAKDSVRKQDLSTIATALVAYFTDHKTYPPADETNLVLDYSSDQNLPDWIPDLKPYLPRAPLDPLQGSLIAPKVAGTSTKTFSVVAGNDDVQGGHSGDFPGFSKGGTSLQITKTNAYGYFKPGLRFINIDLPNDATITAARLVFTPKNDTASARSLNSTSGVNIGITTDITHTPSSQVNDYNDFFARWDIPNQPEFQWQEILDVPTWYNNGNPIDPAATIFDVTDLVKGEINRPNWQANYPINFFLMPRDQAGFSPGRGRIFYSYEGDQTQTPRLEIDYETTPPTPTPASTPMATATPVATPIPTPPPTQGACNNKIEIYCYRVSPDRKKFILWTTLENINDPDTYDSNTEQAICNNNDPEVIPPTGSSLNYCVKSPPN